MRISLTLSTYIGRHFLVSFFTCFGIFLLVVMLFDSIELLRRTSALPNVDFTDVLEFAFLRLPHLGQKLFPFAILFGGMAAFWRLARTHELVITRAAGVSAWQFLLPVGTGRLIGAVAHHGAQSSRLDPADPLRTA